MANYIMQARSSSDDQLYTWLATGAPDFPGVDFPGPGTAEDPAILTVVPGAGGGGGPLWGFDQTVEQISLGATGGSFVLLGRSEFVPLQIVLTGVTPGDVLVVDWAISFTGTNELNFYACPCVSFEDTPSFPDDYNYISDAAGSQTITASFDQRGSCSGGAGLVIPGGTSKVTIRMMHRCDGLGTIGGVDSDITASSDARGTSAWMRAKVIPAASVIDLPSGEATQAVAE